MKCSSSLTALTILLCTRRFFVVGFSGCLVRALSQWKLHELSNTSKKGNLHSLHHISTRHSRSDVNHVSFTAECGIMDGEDFILLLSLKWLGSNSDPTQFSKDVTEAWRWKDALLGDGRDFFVPKQRTLSKLQNIILQSCQQFEENWSLSECVVLSNCARFEIILVLDRQPYFSCDENQREQLIRQVLEFISHVLTKQVDSFRHRTLVQSHLPLDWPASIVSTISSSDPSVNGVSHSSLQSLQSWSVVTGVKNVAEHLCLIAAGMARRPRRPDRDVVFRPFSSRDAHIMLQLKRTLEIASPITRSYMKIDCPKASKLAALLRFAIRAGKAARDPRKVASLNTLRQMYGTTNSKLDVQPPEEFMRNIAKSAKLEAVDPVVTECVAYFKSLQNTGNISSFRQSAFELAYDADSLSLVKQRLHQPTMCLRRGEEVDVKHFLEELSHDLAAMQQSVTNNNVDNI